MDSKTINGKNRPLKITRETKTLFEQLHPDFIGLLELYEKRGLLIIEEED